MGHWLRIRITKILTLDFFPCLPTSQQNEKPGFFTLAGATVGAEGYFAST
jgi:hypothetical protein